MMINELVAAAGTTPRLTDHDGYDWHVHYFAPRRLRGRPSRRRRCGWRSRFFVVAGERERLRRCEAPDCRRAFVDLSRNRSRRYCDSPPAATGCMWPPTGPGARRLRAERGGGAPSRTGPARCGRRSRRVAPGRTCTAHSNSRSCSAAMRSRHPITARKIIAVAGRGRRGTRAARPSAARPALCRVQHLAADHDAPGSRPRSARQGSCGSSPNTVRSRSAGERFRTPADPPVSFQPVM